MDLFDIYLKQDTFVVWIRNVFVKRICLWIYFTFIHSDIHLCVYRNVFVRR